MKALHDYIKAKIVADLPAFKTVNLWNNQNNADQLRQEETIRYPAIFVSYQVEETLNWHSGIKDVVMLITFTVLEKNYLKDKVSALDLLDDIDEVMHGFRGIETDTIQFTSFDEVSRTYDIDHDMVNAPEITYRTRYRNLETYNRRNTTQEVTPVGAITVEIDRDLQADWVLATGFWNDLGTWYDTEIWID